MFRRADLVLITKIDLLLHLPDVRMESIVDALGRVMPQPHCIPVSATTGQGMDFWLDWLERDEPRRVSVTPERSLTRSKG